MLCKFRASATTGESPCHAFADVRSPHGYCFAREEIYLHDVAVAYVRKVRHESEPVAARWAERLGVSVDRIRAIAKALKKYERPIKLDVR